MKRVGIIGLGYVGQGMRSLFGLRYDVSIYDPSIPEFADQANVKGVDLAVVCVPTPMAPDGSCDVSIVREVCNWLDAPLVLIKSTVPPGTTDRLNEEDTFTSGWGRFHFSPEYMGEPRNFVPYWKYPDPFRPHWHDFVIVGGMRAAEVMDFFTPIMGPHTRFMCTDSTTAELTKYMENAYLAMKVSFVTEFARLAKAFDVNWHELRSLWQLDPRVEPDHTVVFPDAPGWGGKCLPKDVSAICEAARTAGAPAHLLEALIAVNSIHRAPPINYNSLGAGPMNNSGAADGELESTGVGGIHP